MKIRNTIALILMLFTINAYSQIPQTMSFQGILSDPTTGDPIADDNYLMIFRMFDAATAGTEVWTETHNIVVVVNGLYNVILGSQGTVLPTASFNKKLWLEAQVGTETLLPRFELTTSPYALTANSLLSAEHIIPASGNVGIGTLTPSTELDVAGTVTATSFMGDGSALEGMFWQGGPDISYISGNVGIGTATPSSALDVAGTITAEGLSVSTTLNVGEVVTASSFIGDGSGLTGLASSPWTGSPNLSYTAGNVGIGTSAPAGILHLESAASNSIVSTIGGDPAAGSVLSFYKANGTIGAPSAILTGDNLGTIGFAGYQSAAYSNLAQIDFGAREFGGGITTLTGTVNFQTLNTGLAMQSRLFIDQLGRVGIGTNSPVYALDVAESAHIKNSLGVGTTNSPEISVQIGALDFTGDVGGMNTTSAKISAVAAEAWGGGTFGTDLHFYTTPVGGTMDKMMTIRHDGNVGIGTTDPIYRLQVDGYSSPAVITQTRNFDPTGRTSFGWENDVGKLVRFSLAGSSHGIPNSFYLWTSDAGSIFTIDINGQMGIGTGTPTSKLDVAGTVTSTGLKVVDGNQATGRVLTSDASGVASWAFSSKNTLITSIDADITTQSPDVTIAAPGIFELLLTITDQIIKVDGSSALEITFLPNLNINGTIATGGELQVQLNGNPPDYGANFVWTILPIVFSTQSTFYFTGLPADTYTITIMVKTVSEAGQIQLAFRWFKPDDRKRNRPIVSSWSED